MSTGFSKNGVLSGSILEDQYKDKISLYSNSVSIPKNIVNFKNVVRTIGNLTLDVDDYGFHGTRLSDNATLRISNLGFNSNSPKTYTVSFYIKSDKDISGGIDLCDAAPVTPYTATTSWKKIVFTANVTNYYNQSLGYNGFLDINVNSTDATVYIKHLKIEEGINNNPIFTPYEANTTSISNAVEVSGLIEY